MWYWYKNQQTKQGELILLIFKYRWYLEYAKGHITDKLGEGTDYSPNGIEKMCLIRGKNQFCPSLTLYITLWNKKLNQKIK